MATWRLRGTPMTRSFTRFTVAVVLAGCAGFTTSSVPAAAPQTPPAPPPPPDGAAAPLAAFRGTRNHARHLLRRRARFAERPITQMAMAWSCSTRQQLRVRQADHLGLRREHEPEDISAWPPVQRRTCCIRRGTLGRDRSRDRQVGLDHNPASAERPAGLGGRQTLIGRTCRTTA